MRGEAGLVTHLQKAGRALSRVHTCSMSQGLRCTDNDEVTHGLTACELLWKLNESVEMQQESTAQCDPAYCSWAGNKQQKLKKK